MKGWVGLVGGPVADGLPTLVVTHQLQVERKTGKVRRPETDVLPLSHATNLVGGGVTPVEFRGDLWHQKPRVSGLSCGAVCVILCLAVLVELRLWRTDRRTDGHRAMASTADA